jgi:antitoxin component YwqK of YwqJK toxin-antitoxin module
MTTEQYERDGKIEEHYQSGCLREKITRYTNGQMECQEFYLNGLLDGERKMWDIQGYLIFTEFYVNGLLDGEKKYYIDQRINSKVAYQEMYARGKLNGPSFRYNPHGQLIYRGNFTDDERDGKQIWWHSNGNLYKVQPYTKGIPNGLFREWDERGNLLSEIRFPIGVYRKGQKS